MPVNFVHKCLNPFVFNSILKNKDTVKNKKKQISLGQVKLIIKHMKCIKNMGLQFNALRPAFTMFVTQLDWGSNLSAHCGVCQVMLKSLRPYPESYQNLYVSLSDSVIESVSHHLLPIITTNMPMISPVRFSLKGSCHFH